LNRGFGRTLHVDYSWWWIFKSRGDNVCLA